jgi:membrane protease YdiL (CAAX protease family)
VWLSLALLMVALLVTVPVYSGLPTKALVIANRFVLAALWGLLALATTRTERLAWARPVLLSLFGVSLGFSLTYFVGDGPAAWLGLSTARPLGAALCKLSEALPLYAAIFLAAYLARQSLASLDLQKGRLWLSLGLGLLSAVPLLAMIVLDPAGDIKALLALPPGTVLSWLPWIGLFSIANGFMEELWFRGSWFGAWRQAIGSSAAMHVTSLAFGLAHVIVYWGVPSMFLLLAPVWLYMGYAYAFIVRKTGSLWGAVLSHAIADGPVPARRLRKPRRAVGPAGELFRGGYMYGAAGYLDVVR